MREEGYGVKNLNEQAAWSTPQARDFRSGHPERRDDPERSKNLNDQLGVVNSKLNSRWVETLMGLPVGWTMPSCVSPVTIEPTSSDSSETELFQPRPPKHSEP
jgi:hypothetical protein